MNKKVSLAFSSILSLSRALRFESCMMMESWSAEFPWTLMISGTSRVVLIGFSSIPFHCQSVCYRLHSDMNSSKYWQRQKLESCRKGKDLAKGKESKERIENPTVHQSQTKEHVVSLVWNMSMFHRTIFQNTTIHSRQSWHRVHQPDPVLLPWKISLWQFFMHFANNIPAPFIFLDLLWQADSSVISNRLS